MLSASGGAACVATPRSKEPEHYRPPWSFSARLRLPAPKTLDLPIDAREDKTTVRSVSLTLLWMVVALACRVVVAQPLEDTPRRGWLDPFAPGTTTIEAAGAYWLESWNKNLTTEQFVGGHVTLGRSWMPSWQACVEVELLRAGLASHPDAFQVAAGGLVRRRVLQTRAGTGYLEAGLGMSAATAPVPAGGTGVNFLLQGGAGLVRPLGRWSAVVGAVRLWHLSNGGMIRGHSRNPDIQALGGYVGLIVGRPAER
jgi:hypothetical protein